MPASVRRVPASMMSLVAFPGAWSRPFRVGRMLTRVVGLITLIGLVGLYATYVKDYSFTKFAVIAAIAVPIGVLMVRLAEWKSRRGG